MFFFVGYGVCKVKGIFFVRVFIFVFRLGFGIFNLSGFKLGFEVFWVCLFNLFLDLSSIRRKVVSWGDMDGGWM